MGWQRVGGLYYFNGIRLLYSRWEPAGSSRRGSRPTPHLLNIIWPISLQPGNHFFVIYIFLLIYLFFIFFPSQIARECLTAARCAGAVIRVKKKALSSCCLTVICINGWQQQKETAAVCAIDCAITIHEEKQQRRVNLHTRHSSRPFPPLPFT